MACLKKDRDFLLDDKTKDTEALTEEVITEVAVADNLAVQKALYPDLYPDEEEEKEGEEGSQPSKPPTAMSANKKKEGDASARGSSPDQEEPEPPKELTLEEKQDINSDVRLKLCTDKLLTHELTNKRFLSLADRKVIRHENVVKAIYYLLEFNKEDVCLPETQKLFWKIAKKHWSKDLLDKMVAFVYSNAKGHEIKSYQTLDFVQGLLGEITFEELSQYNYSLAMILKWIKLAIEARRRDIGKRSNEKKVLREERDAKIEEEKERVERRTKDVEE